MIIFMYIHEIQAEREEGADFPPELNSGSMTGIDPSSFSLCFMNILYSIYNQVN